MLAEIDTSDWGQVFADENYGNVSKELECFDCSDSPFTRENVVKILAIAEGENDGPDWCGLFILVDGRYLAATGGCDYTGWD